MDLFKYVAILAPLAMAVPQFAAASPLSMGSWNHIARIADDGGGMFDGNGDLLSTYSYGTKTGSALSQSADFQTPFDVYDGMQILFITGDEEVWGQTAYADLRAVIDAQSGTFATNITFDARVGGVEQTVAGNVLSRSAHAEDPWIGLVGDHISAINNSLIIWGEDNWFNAGSNHDNLKNAHGGVNVFVSFEVDSSVPAPTPLWMLSGMMGWMMLRQRNSRNPLGQTRLD